MYRYCYHCIIIVSWSIGRHERGWKRARARRLVLANPSQRRLLKKLVPHFKDTRRTYGGVDVYTEWGHLVKA